MLFEVLFQLHTGKCITTSFRTAYLEVEAGASESWLSWVGGTDYDINKGTSLYDYSFKGSDPHEALMLASLNVVGRGYEWLLREHIDDVHRGLRDNFHLSLNDEPMKEVPPPTDVLLSTYISSSSQSFAEASSHSDNSSPSLSIPLQTHLETLLFHYGRYFLFSSSRAHANALPANLQGIWSKDWWSTWSSDYRESSPDSSLRELPNVMTHLERRRGY